MNDFPMTHISALSSEIQIGSIRFRADSSGALWQDEERVLIVADLHLEKGSSLARRRGTLLPPYDTRATLSRLGDVIARLSPKRVIALGDTWHDDKGPTRLDDADRVLFLNLLRRAEFFFIAGNHDAAPAERDHLNFVTELFWENLIFRHEPQIDARYEIAGHLHPVAKVKARGRALRRRCFIANANRIILPAFGAYAGGLNICDPVFDPLFKDDVTKVLVLGQDRVYQVGSDHLIAD